MLACDEKTNPRKGTEAPLSQCDTYCKHLVLMTSSRKTLFKERIINFRKEEVVMATATFDKTFVIDNPVAQEKLYEVIDGKKKSKKKFNEIYTLEEKRRSESALNRLVSILRA